MGGLLARQPENEVTFVATESTAAALNSKGLRVNSDHYRAFSVAVRAVTRLIAPVDVCVVAVKAMQLRGAMERVSNGVVAGSVVVPFLNGVEHVETLRQMYGDVVAPGTVRVASTRSAPGNPIELDGIGEAVLRAATRTGVVAPVTQRLVVELRQRAGARGSVQ
jgi:2-dehydropantoate 2-reductase